MPVQKKRKIENLQTALHVLPELSYLFANGRIFYNVVFKSKLRKHEQQRIMYSDWQKNGKTPPSKQSLSPNISFLENLGRDLDTYIYCVYVCISLLNIFTAMVDLDRPFSSTSMMID